MFLLEQTISMILILPNFDENSVKSLPIYQGKIVGIENDSTDENLCDLIVRIPSFRHQKSYEEIPKEKSSEPILSESTEENLTIETRPTSKVFNGFRQLSRTIIENCKMKRTLNLNEIQFVPMMPDVEVMPEKILVRTETKKSESKSMPKLFSIKKKYLKIKRKSAKKETQPDVSTVEVNPPEKETEELPVDQDAVATHPYSSIPVETTENLPTIFLHSETNETERIFPEETPYENDEPNEVEERISECYEISYEIDEKSDENPIVSDEDYSVILHFIEQVHRMDTIESETKPSETTL